MADTKKPETAAPVTPVAGANVETNDIMKKLGFTHEQMMFIQQLTVAAVMGAKSGTAGPQAPGSNQIFIPQCEHCQQLVTACKNKHVKMVVYPSKYPEFAKWFAGVIINGVRYLSVRDSHSIIVPACTESTITNAIKTFEENERTVNIPRNKSHNSGSLGKRGNGGVKAESAWR